MFEGRPVELISAFSAAEARDVLSKTDDVALILLDVVMETEDAGLKFVRHVRQSLGNRSVRIVLRTGQPGSAPEQEVIVDFDINDYRAKTELTHERLTVCTITALRSYRDIRTVEANNQALRRIADSAVGMFRSSSNLAGAYGIAVCTDMLITTVLTFYVIRYGWQLPLALCIGATGFFFVVDFAFWASNLMKLFDGGWFPLVIGGAIFTLMLTWHDGRRLMREALQADAFKLSEFLDAVFIAPPARVDGTAVFLTSENGNVPNALLHNLKHNKVLHKQNLFVTVRSHEVPWIDVEKRLEFEPLGHDCWQVIVNYGFKNDPDLPKALEQLKGQGCELDPMNTSYFLSRDIVIPTIGGGMATWREKLFAQMHHNASAAAEFLNLPTNAVVELGSKIEI